MISTLFRTLISTLTSHRKLALENLALRQQIIVLQRSVKRPRLKKIDRVSWMLLSKTWSDWANTLTLVKPDTVVRWHRQGHGRPAAPSEVRQLIRGMSQANSLWGVTLPGRFYSTYAPEATIAGIGMRDRLVDRQQQGRAPARRILR